MRHPLNVRLERWRDGLWYTLTELTGGEDGKEVVFQTDWEYPCLASYFGYVACECGATDGTADCEHRTASEMIAGAVDWLDEHDGEVIPDPGYFVDG